MPFVVACQVQIQVGEVLVQDTKTYEGDSRHPAARRELAKRARAKDRRSSGERHRRLTQLMIVISNRC